MTGQPGFTGHLYGYGRNKTTAELAKEILADLDSARETGRLPSEILCRAGAVVRAVHSDTIVIVATGPVHPAEYATILEIANAYNKIEPRPHGWPMSAYRLEIFAPGSPEVQAHPAMALIGRLGAYRQAWHDQLADHDAFASVQHALELAATVEALGAAPPAEVDGTLPPAIATYTADGVLTSAQSPPDPDPAQRCVCCGDAGHVHGYGINMPFTVPGTHGPAPAGPGDWVQRVLYRHRFDSGRQVRLTLEVLDSHQAEDGQRDATTGKQPG